MLRIADDSSRIAIRSSMRLGLIAGNGRFPFLVLDAARAQGHEVTVVAVKEEAFPELADAAAREPTAALHWVSLGQLGTCIRILKDAGATTRRDGRAGQARQDLLRHRARPDAAVGPDAAESPQHGRPHLGRRRRPARPWHRADRFDGAPGAAAGARRRVDAPGADAGGAAPTSPSVIAWPMRSRASTSVRRSRSETRRSSPLKPWKAPTQMIAARAGSRRPACGS